AVDQDWLADQRQVFRARCVAIGLADAFGKRRGDAAGKEGRDVEFLPRFEIGPDHDRDLGVELHEIVCTVGIARNSAPHGEEAPWRRSGRYFASPGEPCGPRPSFETRARTRS